MKLLKTILLATYFVFSVPSFAEYLSENTVPPKNMLVIGTMQEVDTSHATYRFIEAAYRSIGYRISLLSMPYARSFYESNRGEILDGELARTEDFSLKAPDMIRIPVPIEKVAATVFSNDPSFTPKSWEDLRGKRIDIMEGTDIILGRLGDMPATSVTTLEQAFLRLESGRTDTVIVPGEIGQKVLDSLNLENIYRVSPDLEAWLVYHYIHKRHEELVEPLTTALSEVMEAHPIH